MANGDEARVYDLLLKQVQAFVSKPDNGYRVAIPNKEFTPTVYPYLEMQTFPANSDAGMISNLKKISGVLMVTVIAERNTGIDTAREIASDLIAEFYPENTLRIFDAGGLCVEFTKQANERPPLFETNEMRVPVTIPYQAFI